jgi:hypothetical protein
MDLNISVENSTIIANTTMVVNASQVNPITPFPVSLVYCMAVIALLCKEIALAGVEKNCYNDGETDIL